MLDASGRIALLPLIGPKVIVRLMTVADLTASYIGWLNDPAIMQYSNQRFIQHDLASVQSYFDTFEGGENHFLAIESVADGRLVGTMTVYVQSFHATADIGILVGVGANGFGTEAWEMVVDWLIEDCVLRKVTAGTVSSNTPMIRLMEKTGMHLEATRRHQEIIEGVSKDICYFAKFNAG